MPRKSNQPKPLNPTHVAGRHGPNGPSAPPIRSAPPVPAEPPPGSVAIWILCDGSRVANITVDSIPDDQLAATLYGLTAWAALGADLAARGPRRLTLGEHVARAAATGGIEMDLHEEALCVAFFEDLLDQAHTLGGNAATMAVWNLLVTDRHRHPTEIRQARCPAVEAMRLTPGEPGFLMALRSALGGYVRTAIGGASESELEKLRWLMVAPVDIIEETSGRPWSRMFGADESNGRAVDLLAPALDYLTRRNPTTAQLCSGVGFWADAFAQIAVEHTIPPVARLGAIVWLVRVALSSVERAA